MRVHGRQPELEDAADHGGAEWAERLAALQEVRKRLLVGPRVCGAGLRGRGRGQ